MCAIRSKDEALIVMDKLKKRWKDSCEGKDEAYNMLTNLHVKNLALIDEIEVEFGPIEYPDGGDRCRKIYYHWFGESCPGQEDV